MSLPVKRVENRTGNHTRKQKYGTGGSASIRNSGDGYENRSETDDAGTDKNLRLTSNTCKYPQ